MNHQADAVKATDYWHQSCGPVRYLGLYRFLLIESTNMCTFIDGYICICRLEIQLNLKNE